MKKCLTYVVMLPDSNAGLNDDEMEKINSLLHEFLQKDAFLSIHLTPCNQYRYTVGITILRNSLKDATPICDAIMSTLEKAGEKPVKAEIALYYGKDVPRVFSEL